MSASVSPLLDRGRVRSYRAAFVDTIASEWRWAGRRRLGWCRRGRRQQLSACRQRRTSRTTIRRPPTIDQRGRRGAIEEQRRDTRKHKDGGSSVQIALMMRSNEPTKITGKAGGGPRAAMSHRSLRSHHIISGLTLDSFRVYVCGMYMSHVRPSSLLVEFYRR